MDDQEVGEWKFEKTQQRSNSPSGFIHESHRFDKYNLVLAKSALADHSFELQAFHWNIKGIS